jgi:hypothetical protein
LTHLSSVQNLSVDNDEQWTVFSPQMTEVTSGLESEMDDITQDEQQIGDDLLGSGENSQGTSTPLAFPTHNGSGSFFSAGSELADRVNAWRLDQSQLVLQELQRLEQKFFWSPSGLEQSTNNESIPVQRTSQIKGKNESSLWDRFVQDFIGFNDQVMEMLFGDRYFEEVPEELPSDHNLESIETSFVHYNQALKMGPPGWQDRIIQGVLDRLNIPAGTDVKFLRYLGSRILELNRPRGYGSEPFYPKLRDVPIFEPRNNYWEDSLVSSNWEQSSISTPVW